MAEEETSKLHVKVGDSEFNAEGTREDVQRQFELFRDLVANRGTATPTDAPPPSPADQKGGDGESTNGTDPSTLSSEEASRVFQVDRKGKLVTLRVLPTGSRRAVESALLLLLGFQELLNKEEVLVGQLKDALQQSGLQPDRIDRIMAPHLRDGLVRKGGRGPGGRYRLSNTGQAEAERLVRDLA